MTTLRDRVAEFVRFDENVGGKMARATAKKLGSDNKYGSPNPRVNGPFSRYSFMWGVRNEHTRLAPLLELLPELVGYLECRPQTELEGTSRTGLNYVPTRASALINRIKSAVGEG